MAAVLDSDGQMRLRFMEHSFGAEDGLFNDGMLLNRWGACLKRLTSHLGKFSSAIASLAMSFGRACGQDGTFEDILLISKRYLTAGTLCLPEQGNDLVLNLLSQILRNLSLLKYIGHSESILTSPWNRISS